MDRSKNQWSSKIYSQWLQKNRQSLTFCTFHLLNINHWADTKQRDEQLTAQSGMKRLYCVSLRLFKWYWICQIHSSSFIPKNLNKRPTLWMNRKLSCVFIQFKNYYYSFSIRSLIVFRLKSIFPSFHVPSILCSLSCASQCGHMIFSEHHFLVWFFLSNTISSLAQTYVFRIMWNGSLFLVSAQGSFSEWLQKLFFTFRREKNIQFQSSFSNMKNGAGEWDVMSMVYGIRYIVYTNGMVIRKGELQIFRVVVVWTVVWARRKEDL